MKKIILLLSGIMPFLAICQKTITGKIFDITNSHPLAQASIVLQKGNTGTAAGNDGKFTLHIPENVKIFTVSYVGYQSVTIDINASTIDYAIGLQPLQNQQELVVIGTRNLSRTNVQTPVPVDIIRIATMANEVGQVDLTQLLTYAAPSFQSSRQAVADGTDHVDPAQLRGLGGDQVLVLVNGKRRHQSALVNVNGTVNRGQVGTDLNSIPVTAIERVEVLRDGAAAQYGSDAIAGVINIVLKKSTNVLGGNISYGENITSYEKDFALDKINNKAAHNTSARDGASFQAGLNYGINLNKRGYLNITGEYTLRDRSNRTGTYTGPVYANVGGVNRDDSILQARELSRNDFDMRIGNSKIASGAVMINGSYALSSKWNLKLFGGYNQKSGEAAGFFRYPSSISSSAGAGIYTAQALALYPNGFLPLIKTSIKDYSLSAGIDGAIGQWHASLSNTLGINDFDFTVDHSLNYTQFAAITKPADKIQSRRITVSAKHDQPGS